MELTIFHNCQNVVSILEQCDIGQRIAINDDDVAQETLFNLAHFVSHECFTAVSRGGTKHFPGLEAHQVHKMLEVAAISAHGDPSKAIVAERKDLDTGFVHFCHRLATSFEFPFVTNGFGDLHGNAAS